MTIRNACVFDSLVMKHEVVFVVGKYDQIPAQRKGDMVLVLRAKKLGIGRSGHVDATPPQPSAIASAMCSSR
jgi:hypothetical protein